MMLIMAKDPQCNCGCSCQCACAPQWRRTAEAAGIACLAAGGNSMVNSELVDPVIP